MTANLSEISQQFNPTGQEAQTQSRYERLREIISDPSEAWNRSRQIRKLFHFIAWADLDDPETASLFGLLLEFFHEAHYHHMRQMIDKAMEPVEEYENHRNYMTAKEKALQLLDRIEPSLWIADADQVPALLDELRDVFADLGRGRSLEEKIEATRQYMERAASILLDTVLADALEGEQEDRSQYNILRAIVGDGPKINLFARMDELDQVFQHIGKYQVLESMVSRIEGWVSMELDSLRRTVKETQGPGK